MEDHQIQVGSEKSVSEGFSRRSQIPLLVLIGLLGLFSIAFIFGAVYTSRINLLILAAAFSLTTIVGVLASSKVWLASEWIKYLVFSLLLEISISLTSAILPVYSGFPYAFLAIILAFSIASILPSSRNSEWIIWTGLLGIIGSILLSILAPFDQIIDINVQYVVFGFTGIVLIGLIYLFLSKRVIVSLRVKLILGALALSLIPLIALALINNQYLRTSIQAQANDSLQVAANQTISEIDSFIQQNLDSISNEASLPAVVDYLSLDPAERSGTPKESQVLITFRSLQSKQKIYLPSYALLNFVGTNLIDTTSQNIGKSERATSYFKQSANTGSTYVSSVEFESGTRNAYLNFISPVLDQSKQVIGYLRVRYDAHILQTMIEKYVGLIGNRSYPILIDNNGLRLADGSSPNLIFRTISQLSTEEYQTLINSGLLPSYLPQSLLNANQEDIASIAFANRTSDFFTTSSTIGNTKFQQLGVIKRVESEPWQVVFLQDQTTLTQSINNQNRLSAIISTLIAGLVAIFITIVANSFSKPILDLTDAAEKIAQGDFGIQATIKSKDEIGVLGNSFNSMTRQLKDLIDSLESRVQERTKQLAQQFEALQFRSRQLQTVSDVARGVVSSRELESLLSTVTTLISERFNFYHVGIFLNDNKNEFAVLRAANSAGGRKMLARQHKLQVGQVGIVGYVTGTGNPRIATDVGQDAVFFNNPDLPETKSEMALPLKVGDKTIGALDVQSTQSNAFTNEDVELFSTLADQVAVAINNNQLYLETSKALEEAEKVHKQYLNQEWTRQSTEASVSSVRFANNSFDLFSEELPEVKMVLESARPVFKSQKDPSQADRFNSSLTVPLILYGEPIGVIHLQESADKPFIWSQNDLLTVQEVSSQVSQSLENARLFEDTIRRADRERKVLEITSKIRSTNDPQQMLQITLEELKKNLGASKAQIVFNLGNSQSGFQEAENKDEQKTIRLQRDSKNTEE